MGEEGMNTHYARRFFTIAFLTLAIGLPPLVSSADSPNDILIIVNKKNKVNKISISEVRQIFLGMRETWSGGEKIICVNPKKDAPVRQVFRKILLGMSSREEHTYWEEQRIRRHIRPPPEISTVALAVFKLVNAISFAYRKDVPNNVVKTVLVIPVQNQ